MSLVLLAFLLDVVVVWCCYLLTRCRWWFDACSVGVIIAEVACLFAVGGDVFCLWWCCFDAKVCLLMLGGDVDVDGGVCGWW